MASVHRCHPCGMLDGYLKSSRLNPPWEYHLQPSSVSFQYRGRPRKSNWGIEKTWRGELVEGRENHLN
ncbi:hypothetical protein PRUPE_4G114400 [Prunus persica]|uniref:Uncharacterized protein n=1 Tax=Prunus persica TaxID=3760 RepID=A0A251PJ49_PRUPE|nr:hypothetical protein PRUPE_4G114400 [Prunus persica]